MYHLILKLMELLQFVDGLSLHDVLIDCIADFFLNGLSADSSGAGAAGIAADTTHRYRCDNKEKM